MLVIEDNSSLAKSIKDYFTNEGFEVTCAYSLKEANSFKNDFAVIILDWMLPDGQGIDFLRELRKKSLWTPVIFLTAKADLIDKVLGLESGANDYVSKPFEPRELLARVRTQLRSSTSPQSLLEGGGLSLNLKTREAFFHKQKIEMTKKEFDLLAMLLKNPHQVFSREELLNQVWGFENFPTTRTVDTHILQLRQKLSEELIQTVRGIGYRITFDQ